MSHVFEVKKWFRSDEVMRGNRRRREENGNVLLSIARERAIWLISH